jgi:hypothetical protein
VSNIKSWSIIIFAIPLFLQLPSLTAVVHRQKAGWCHGPELGGGIQNGVVRQLAGRGVGE